jgi:hypothetical protein
MTGFIQTLIAKQVVFYITFQTAGILLFKKATNSSITTRHLASHTVNDQTTNATMSSSCL